MLWTSLVGGRRVVCVLVNEKPDDLVFIKGLIEAGKIRSVLDKAFPLRQAPGDVMMLPEDEPHRTDPSFGRVSIRLDAFGQGNPSR